MGRLIAGTDLGEAKRKIIGNRLAKPRGDVQADDGIPPFTTLSSLIFVIFVRLASLSVLKLGFCDTALCNSRTLQTLQECPYCLHSALLCLAGFKARS